MTSNPRDFREWMTQVERQGRQLRGIPMIIQNTVEVVVDDINKDKVRHPAAPIELTYQTAFYTDTSSRTRVRFLMDFPDVVFNTDGTDVTIQQYELWAKEETPSALEVTTSAVTGLALPGATLPSLASTESNEAIAAEQKPWTMRDTSVSSFFRTDGFLPGTVWRFRARAIGTTTITPGEWSEELVVQMLADTTPPPQPTAPSLLIQRGTITVSWDGQCVSGAMPADFKYAVLAHGTSSSPTFEIARFGRGGGFKVVADIDYYDPQFFRLAAVDESGNIGPWSEQAVGFTTPLVDKDIILSTIDGAKTYLKNIDARVSILDGTILTEHLVVTEEMTAAIANFLVVNADQINVNSLAADEIFVGLMDAVLVVSDMFEGKSFTGGIFTGGRFQNSVEEYSGFKIDPSGILGYAPGGTGVETFRLDAATGSLTANSGTLTGLKYQTHLAATQGIKIDPTLGFKYYNNSNQLMVDITASSATFTGTVTSGFGGAKAVLSDAVYGGRPGMKIVTGSGYYWEPFIVSYDATSPQTGNRGALFASAAWTSSTAEPGRLLMAAEGTLSLAGYHGGLYTVADTMKVYGGSGNNNYFQAGPSATFMVHNGAGIIQIDTGGITINPAAGTTTIYDGLQVSGSKNFVMDHPTKPGMQLLHGATESPVSGVEYWGCGTIGADGSDVVALPEYFTALVKPGTACVGVWGNGAQVSWDTEVIDNTVTVNGPAGTGYMWLVKAERIGADFPIEQEKVEWIAPDTTSEPGIQR